MDADTYQYLFLLVSFILSAFYSGSEAALVAMPVDRTKQLIEEGGGKGRAFEFLSSHPNGILTTILVGNNLANIFAASLSTSLAASYFEDNALGISVGVVTFIILIFGEIIPKTFARAHSETLSYPIIIILRINFYLLYPIVKPLTWFITKLLGKNAHLTGRIVTSEDIEYMVNKAEQEQTMDSKQLDLLTSILEFPLIKVKDIMIHRQKVISIQADSTFPEVINIIRSNTHSRYPVCEGELDNTIGFLHVKDLAFVSRGRESEFSLRDYVKPLFFVYEHMKIQAIFDYLNRNKVHLALVKDENGLVVGIVTLEDIMEEIFGEITDEHDVEEADQFDEEDIHKGAIIVEGDISLRDLYNEFDIKIPLNDNYSTLRGFILDQLGDYFPRQRDIISWKNYSFELTGVENSEIYEIKIEYVEHPAEEVEEGKQVKIETSVVDQNDRVDGENKEANSSEDGEVRRNFILKKTGN